MTIDGITGMAVSEDRIQAVMRALDLMLDQPPDADWDVYLRKLAITAIETGGSDGNGQRTSH